jgi:hypothetical protein
MTRILVALAAAIVLVGAVVQTSAAKPDVSVGAEGSGPSLGAPVEASATASASGGGSTVTAIASCPPGTKVAGGGFDAPYSNEVIGLVYESVKVRNRSWRASAQLLDPGQPSSLTLTAYAYCRSHLSSLKTETETAPTTGETQIGPTVSPSCSRGDAAVSGGFAIGPPLRDETVTALLLDSARAGLGGWDTQVITGPAGASVLTGEVHCSRRLDAPAEITGVSAPNASDFTPSTAAAECPLGLSAAAGGFAQPDSTLTSFFLVYESRRVGDGWQVSGLHSGNDPAVRLRASAYCA